METLSSPVLEILEPPTAAAPILPAEPSAKIAKQAIRTSLKASTLDGVFAAIFSSITGGVLPTNFLLKLGASPIEIGLLSSIPMMVNLLQPVGAYIADRMTSRHLYCLWIYVPARLLWLTLVLGMFLVGWLGANPHQLILWTLGIIFVTNILSALGCSSWLSWMAALVPPSLRGRYFGFRNSAASLTTLLSVPLLGFVVSIWPSGAIHGYGAVVVLGIVAGIISLGFQFFMVDVNPLNPQAAIRHKVRRKSVKQVNLEADAQPFHAEGSILKDTNFLTFLLYFGLWMFAVNLSAPFFNLYMLDSLHLNLNWVTLYTSLAAGANLLMLMLWGRLADRLGNRPLLLLVGIVVAVAPLFWLIAGTNSVSLWLWLPLIHMLNGGTGAAIDLCNNNIQMEVAPVERPSTYFAIAAAVAGVCGGLGTTVGGFLAQGNYIGGLPGLFALSTIVRLVALLPLVYVQEPRSQSVVRILQNFFSRQQRSPLLSAAGNTNSAQ